MRDPRAILSQVRQGSVPPTWKIFTKKRGAVGGFFSGTSRDPDPMLVFTPEGVLEYINEKKPLAVIIFNDVSEIRLQVHASTMSDSMNVWLDVWLDLYYFGGKKVKWQPSSFKNDLQVIQHFIETYAVYKAFHRRQ
ncbi:MAG TPA: hypothetical protein VE843_18720 [Ktedonobacteraceae bacterium]|nr:hypothetical protein [Ktedonobacteraceae bacterium]